MISYCFVLNNKILAIYEVDELPEFVGIDPRYIETPNGAKVGYEFVNGEWVEPEIEEPNQVPTTLSSYQAKLALFNAGLLTSVQSLIDHPDTPTNIKLAWQEGLSFRRDNPMIATIATQLGLSETDIDDLFIAGEQLSPDYID